MRFMGWLSLSIGFALALAFPLLLLGAPKEAVWPIALVCGAILLVLRPGGTTERFFGGLFAYGLVFSLWCVAGLVVCMPLALLFSGFRAPAPVYVIAAFGIFGAIRELAKVDPPARVAAGLLQEPASAHALPMIEAHRQEAPSKAPLSPSALLRFDNTKQRMEARAKARRELGE